MRKPIDRRWNYLSMDKVREMTKNATAESIWLDDPSLLTYASSDILAGKALRFLLDDGSKIDYEFILLFKKLGDAPKPSLLQKENSKMTSSEWNQYFACKPLRFKILEGIYRQLYDSNISI